MCVCGEEAGGAWQYFQHDLQTAHCCQKIVLFVEKPPNFVSIFVRYALGNILYWTAELVDHFLDVEVRCNSCSICSKLTVVDCRG